MIKTEAYNESKQFLGLTKKNGVNTSKLYTQKPLGFFSVTRNLAAYRTNQEGVLELMGANVPRIDYPITILEPARTNLILYSQEFNNAAWIKTASSITANIINAPDGTLTGDKLVENASTGTHYMYPAVNISVINGINYTLSVYAKNNGRRYFLLYDGFNDIGKFFDLQTGTILGTQGSGTLINSSIQLINGWYRCSITYQQAGNFASPQIYLSSTGSNFSYTGNGTSGIYLWGEQLETGNTATAYIPTTNAPVTVPAVIEAQCPELLVENEATNLVLRSQEFNNAAWAKTNVTVTANTAIAPDGTMTADSAVSNSGSLYSALTQNRAVSQNSTFTFSIYIKKETTQTGFGGLSIAYTGTSTKVCYVIFNPITGTYNVASSNITPIVNVFNIGNYWRVSVTATDNGNNTNIYAEYYAYLSTNGTTLSPGLGSQRTIWGAQLEQGNKATSYIPTTTTSVTRPADNIRNNTIGYDNEESTIFVRARLNFTTDYQGIATLWDGDDIYNGYITMYYYISGGVRYIAFDTYNGSDTNQYLYTAPSDGVYSIAFAYHTGEGAYKIAINGVLITDDTFFNDFPSYTLLTQMTLGSFLTYFNSRTKGFMYFDSMLGNDSLENLTVQ